MRITGDKSKYNKKRQRAKAKQRRRQANFVSRHRADQAILQTPQPGISDFCGEDKFQYAKRLTENQTPSELEFGRLATPHRLGFKLYKQAVVLGYIVDFYSFKHKIAVEIDGSVHQTQRQKAWDWKRDKAMRSAGIMVIRFPATTNETALMGQIFRLKEAFNIRSGKSSLN